MKETLYKVMFCVFFCCFFKAGGCESSGFAMMAITTEC